MNLNIILKNALIYIFALPDLLQIL